MYISEFKIIGPVETSQIVLGSLIPLDVPIQVRWHMRGLRRNGGTTEELKYAVDIAKMISDAMGVTLKTKLPDPCSIIE